MRARTRKNDRPGRPIADPSRDTRALLLNAATGLFAQQGVAATTFATIAHRAGLTSAMVHYYFPDRDQLLDAVVDERLVPFIHAVWDPVAPSLPPRELVAGVVHRLLQQITLAPWVPSTWMREILTDGGLLRQRIFRRLPFDKLRQVAHAIANAQKNQTVNPDVDPLLLVFSAFGLVMLHAATMKMWSEVFQRPQLNTEELQRHITGLLLEGLHADISHQPRSAPHSRTGRHKP